MIILGIILLAVGLVLYFLTPPPVNTIGLVCAVIGGILLVIGLVLLLADDTSLHHAAVPARSSWGLLAPLWLPFATRRAPVL